MHPLINELTTKPTQPLPGRSKQRFADESWRGQAHLLRTSVVSWTRTRVARSEEGDESDHVRSFPPAQLLRAPCTNYPWPRSILRSSLWPMFAPGRKQALSLALPGSSPAGGVAVIEAVRHAPTHWLETVLHSTPRPNPASDITNRSLPMSRYVELTAERAKSWSAARNFPSRYLNRDPAAGSRIISALAAGAKPCPSHARIYAAC